MITLEVFDMSTYTTISGAPECIEQKIFFDDERKLLVKFLNEEYNIEVVEDFELPLRKEVGIYYIDVQYKK